MSHINAFLGEIKFGSRKVVSNVEPNRSDDKRFGAQNEIPERIRKYQQEKEVNVFNRLKLLVTTHWC